MQSLKQQALDYTLGVLPKEESLLFEALIEEDEEAQNVLSEALDDFASLSLTAKPSTLGNEVRKRVIENCQPKINLDPFLGSKEIETLRDTFSSIPDRYTGGGGSVDLSDLKSSAMKDDILFNYENLIRLLPLVSGNSRAASGDFSALQTQLRSHDSFTNSVFKTLDQGLQGESPASRSVLRSALSSMPSLAFFSDRLRADQATVGDARRLFYLCRDQLKIMRASFRDLDSERLIEDEKLRYHGAGLLRTKWWGAEHAYFSSNGTVRCGHFFDGPITERCVEFAEYDANMYCLANLLSPRSADGEFHMELLKDTIPGCTLAVTSAKMSVDNFNSLASVIDRKSIVGNGLEQDIFLWDLIEDTMVRGHKNGSVKELREQMTYGYNRINDTTYLWFAWPAIPNAQ